MLVVTAVGATCAVLALALEAALERIWRANFRAGPPADWLVILAWIGALLIAAFGLWVVPRYQMLFESYGADLHWPTRIVLQYQRLLVLPVPLLAVLQYFLRRHERRGRYLAYFLAGEFALATSVMMALYMSVFATSEAVQG